MKQVSTKPSTHISIAILIAFVLIISWIALLTHSEQIPYQEQFSEFYLRDSASLLRTNGLELSENEEGAFSVVIFNHEGTRGNYRIHILVNGHQVSTVDNINLEDDESTEKQINFSFPTAGENQRVDILLEKQAAPFPYRSLHLLVNVSSNGQDSP
jgi:uncharacterized membrane protein